MTQNQLKDIIKERTPVGLYSFSSLKMFQIYIKKKHKILLKGTGAARTKGTTYCISANTIQYHMNVNHCLHNYDFCFPQWQN